jgi:hypothetical protein
MSVDQHTKFDLLSLIDEHLENEIDPRDVVATIFDDIPTDEHVRLAREHVVTVIRKRMRDRRRHVFASPARQAGSDRRAQFAELVRQPEFLLMQVNVGAGRHVPLGQCTKRLLADAVRVLRDHAQSNVRRAQAYQRVAMLLPNDSATVRMLPPERVEAALHGDQEPQP